METDKWSGWVAFAGFILLIVGSIAVIQGFFAIIEDDYVVATPKGLAIIDVTGWGWLNMLWGALLFLAGLGLLAGQGWARVFAIIVASIGAVGQMAFMANYPQAYPLWNITILALQVTVIYALIAKWEGYKASVSP